MAGTLASINHLPLVLIETSLASEIVNLSVTPLVSKSMRIDFHLLPAC
jgi:hypothetical protein